MKPKNLYRYFGLLVAGLLVLGTNFFVRTSGSAAPLQATSLTINPAADDYVSQAYPGTNYGTYTSLWVDNSPLTDSYLRFVVSGINSSTIQSARLRLYARSNSSSGYSVKTVSDNSWTEFGITYNNAPAIGSTLNNSGSYKSGNWVEVDVSSYIKAEGTYSIALTTTGNTRLNLASREDSSHAPQLVITLASPPTATQPPANTPTQTKAPTLAPTNPPPSTSTPVPTSLPGQNMTLGSAADTYARSDYPTTNYGSGTTLRVDGSPIVYSFTRFSVPSLNGQTVSQAVLRIHANSSSSSGLTVKSVADNSWGETTLTFANAPAQGSTLDTTSSVTGGSWVSLDVTSLVKGQGTYSFGVSTPGSTAISLSSRESGADAPQLVLSFSGSATPAPTTAPTATSVPIQAPTSTPRPTQAPTLAPTNTPFPTQAPTQAPSPTPTQSGTDWQPSFPIRAAFYYPWFPEAWTQKGIYPYTNYNPTIGFYSNYDQSTIKQHIAMMQYGKIQAGIASWWGQGTQTDSKISGLLSAASGTNFRWSLYYENESMGDPSVSQITADLTYIRDNYGKDPSYLRVNGKFVVFVYADANDACGMADRWKQGNTVGAYVVLKVFVGYLNCASQPDSWHQYSPAVAADQQGSFSYSISPGFWLVNNAVRLNRDLTRWTQNVTDMVASGANWQLITTFSEWGEGTAVEPAAEWASPSGYGQYLDVLHNR
jgi:hypothetical protein